MQFCRSWPVGRACRPSLEGCSQGRGGDYGTVCVLELYREEGRDLSVDDVESAQQGWWPNSEQESDVSCRRRLAGPADVLAQPSSRVVGRAFSVWFVLQIRSLCISLDPSFVSSFLYCRSHYSDTLVYAKHMDLILLPHPRVHARPHPLPEPLEQGLVASSSPTGLFTSLQRYRHVP